MDKLIVKQHIIDVKKWVNGPVLVENNGLIIFRVDKLQDNKLRNKHKKIIKVLLNKMKKNLNLNPNHKHNHNLSNKLFNKHHKKHNHNRNNQK